MSAIFCYAVARETRDTADDGINQSDPTGRRAAGLPEIERKRLKENATIIN